MRIYADTSIYNRPFNDQSQEGIRKETDVILKIFAAAEVGMFELVGSDVLRSEIEATPDAYRREQLRRYSKLCTMWVEENEWIESMTKDLQAECGVKPKDAAHLVSACYGGAQYFVICDDRVTRKASRIEAYLDDLRIHIRVVNPVDFPAQLLNTLTAADVEGDNHVE